MTDRSTKFTIMLMVCLFACWTRNTFATEPDRDLLRFIFITCSVEGKFFEPVKKGMRDAAEAMKVSCDFVGTEGIDVKKQAELVRKAIADGYDGIALNLVDPNAFDDVVQEAIDAGVPVVAFNVDDHDSPNARIASVNQRLYAAGQSLGEYVSPHIPAGSHILMTMHDEGVSALEDRLRGVQDVLRRKGIRWTVVITGNDSVKGAAVIADAMRNHPDIRVVVATGQSDTEASGRAIKQSFSDGNYWAAGFDLSPKTLQLIREGHIRCTVDQQPYVQGFYPVVQLTLLKRFGVVPTDVDAGAAIIESSDVEQVERLTQEGYR